MGSTSLLLLFLRAVLGYPGLPDHLFSAHPPRAVTVDYLGYRYLVSHPEENVSCQEVLDHRILCKESKHEMNLEFPSGGSSV